LIGSRPAAEATAVAARQGAQDADARAGAWVGQPQNSRSHQRCGIDEGLHPLLIPGQSRGDIAAHTEFAGQDVCAD
jgi:hypothetical protein